MRILMMSLEVLFVTPVMTPGFAATAMLIGRQQGAPVQIISTVHGIPDGLESASFNRPALSNAAAAKAVAPVIVRIFDSHFVSSMCKFCGVSEPLSHHSILTTCSARNCSTSLRGGMEVCAPRSVTEMPTTAAANRVLSRTLLPFMSPTANPPLNASPAAVVSMARTSNAGRVWISQNWSFSVDRENTGRVPSTIESNTQRFSHMALLHIEIFPVRIASLMPRNKDQIVKANHN
jgi:hypothetical protein